AGHRDRRRRHLLLRAAIPRLAVEGAVGRGLGRAVNIKRRHGVAVVVGVLAVVDSPVAVLWRSFGVATRTRPLSWPGSRAGVVHAVDGAPACRRRGGAVLRPGTPRFGGPVSRSVVRYHVAVHHRGRGAGTDLCLYAVSGIDGGGRSPAVRHPL